MARKSFAGAALRAFLTGVGNGMSSSIARVGGMVCLALLAAGCAVKKPASTNKAATAQAGPQPAACAPAPAGSALIGTWYALSTPKGVSGHLQSLTTLAADGTMKYETQLKIGSRVRPALRETGCWTFADEVYTLQTLRSNGELVDAEDPIYRNSYRVEKVSATQITSRETRRGAQSVTGRKVPATFRLP